ncbi:MAG: bacillithiol transferase BstA [Fimbriimonadaceae bacterium]|nr:bacillithiol transferase BstA [Chitinophagales bacterium]
MDIEHLKFPIGKYKIPEVYSEQLINDWIQETENYPALLKTTVNGITEQQLETPYRPEGWTARQVIHHIADSHMNAYIRFKLSLTESNPIIKPYMENKWALLDDNAVDINVSLQITELIYKRWVPILRSMRMEGFDRTYIHPEHNKQFTLKYALGLYAWHSKHHLAHIKNCMSNKNN